MPHPCHLGLGLRQSAWRSASAVGRALGASQVPMSPATARAILIEHDR